MALSADDFCPVAESLLGRLYRASPDGVAALVETVPPQTRAALAYYCSRRAHLESLALVIASTCTAEQLEVAGGQAGRDVFNKSRSAHVVPAGPPEKKNRRGVTLATGFGPLHRSWTEGLTPTPQVSGKILGWSGRAWAIGKRRQQSLTFHARPLVWARAN
jgi:hypothetical protein